MDHSIALLLTILTKKAAMQFSWDQIMSYRITLTHENKKYILLKVQAALNAIEVCHHEILVNPCECVDTLGCMHICECAFLITCI